MAQRLVVIGVFFVIGGGGVFANSHGHPVVSLIVRGSVVSHIMRVVVGLVSRLIHVVVVIDTISDRRVMFRHKSVMGTKRFMGCNH